MIDIGVLNHMSGYKGTISNLKEKQLACMVELEDNSTFVPVLKKNILSVYFLEDKCFRFIFMENQAYLWPKNQKIDTTTVIGV